MQHGLSGGLRSQLHVQEAVAGVAAQLDHVVQQSAPPRLPLPLTLTLSLSAAAVAVLSLALSGLRPERAAGQEDRQQVPCDGPVDVGQQRPLDAAHLAAEGLRRLVLEQEHSVAALSQRRQTQHWPQHAADSQSFSSNISMEVPAL